jgi:hypothetical protein
MLVWLGRLAFARFSNGCQGAAAGAGTGTGLGCSPLARSAVPLSSSWRAATCGHGAHDSLQTMLETPEASVRCVIFMENAMATNKPAGDGHRNGAVRKRSQLKDGLFGKQTKRDLTTGQFMDQKKDGGKFKGVRRER